MSDSVPAEEPHARESAIGPAPARSAPDRAYAVAFALAAAFTLAPMWAGTVLPFQDWAGNMSYVAILAGAEDGNLYDRTYSTGGMLLPNGLLFWSWVFLGKLMGFILGGKILLSLYCLGLPVAMDRLLVAAGRDRRFALLAFPLVYNHSMMMGFGSYATALPFIVYCMARAFVFERDPTRRNGAMVTLVASLTFLAHAQAYLILGVISLTFVVMVPRTRRSFWRHCLAFGASLWIFLPWFYSEFIAPAEDTSLGGRDLMPVFEHPGQMFAKWGEHTINRWQGAFDDWVFLGILAVMLVGIISRRVDRQPGEGRSRYAIEAITLALLVTYIAIPEHTLVQAVIGSRLVVVVMLFGIAWLHMPDPPRVRAALLATMTALAVIFGGYAASAVHQFNEEEIGDELLPLIDSLPDGSSLAVITAERESRAVTVLAHHHIYGYHFALNEGLAFSGFHSFHGRHAQWRPGKHMPYPGRDPRAFLRGKSACVYDYLLVRTTNIPRWQHLAPRLTYMGNSARYSMWKIDHDRIPACRKPKKLAKPEPAVAAGEVKEGKKGAISDTLGPSVGPTRGRQLDGKRGALPEDRPQAKDAFKKPTRSGTRADASSAARRPETSSGPQGRAPNVAPRSLGASAINSKAVNVLRRRANEGGLNREDRAQAEPTRRSGPVRGTTPRGASEAQRPARIPAKSLDGPRRGPRPEVAR